MMTMATTPAVGREEGAATEGTATAVTEPPTTTTVGYVSSMEDVSELPLETEAGIPMSRSMSSGYIRLVA